MAANLQSIIDTTMPGDLLQLSRIDYAGEIEGPFVLRKDIQLDGMTGCTLYCWEGPVVNIIAGHVTMENLRIEVTGSSGIRDKKCAIRVSGGHLKTCKNVEVVGEVQGIPGEDGEWRYPKQIDLGVIIPLQRHVHKEHIEVPSVTELISTIAGVDIQPRVLHPGYHEVTISIEPLMEGVHLNGNFLLTTSFFRRVIRLNAAVGRSPGKPPECPVEILPQDVQLQPNKVSNLHCSTSISWIDAIYGVEKKMIVARKEPCEKCGGTGFYSDGTITCSECGGSGCVSQQSELAIKVPAGIYKKERFKIAACGDFGRAEWPRGDAFIDVDINGDKAIRFIGKTKQVAPSCCIYLLDRSSEMGASVSKSSGKTWADVIAEILNRHFRDRVLNTIEQNVDPTCYEVGFIAYGNGSCNGFPGKLEGKYLVNIQELAENPLRIDTRSIKKSIKGKFIEEHMVFPIWLEAAATGDGSLYDALALAVDLVKGWRDRTLGGTLPLILNICATKSFGPVPSTLSQKLKDIGCYNGNLLLFNIALADNPYTEIAFVNNGSLLTNSSTKNLFNISSNLPDQQSNSFRHFKPGKGAKAFIYTSKQQTIIDALRITSL